MKLNPELREESRESGSLDLYLREIGATPLLKREEELALAHRVRKGDEAARDHMVRANLRLVVRLARDYLNQGLPLEDLIAEGNIGLMKAVERFDPKHGVKLSTYAAWWIKQSIRRALSNQSKTIRLPVHIVDKLGHIRKAERKLSEELGREPTDEEISDEMGLPLEKLSQLRRASLPTSSLDAMVGEDGETALGELIADEGAQDPALFAQDKGSRQDLEEMLSELNERERAIVVKRFGLNQSEPMTLEMVGKELKVTRERIRQIQNDAIVKLRRKMKERETLLPEPTDVLLN